MELECTIILDESDSNFILCLADNGEALWDKLLEQKILTTALHQVKI